MTICVRPAAPADAGLIFGLVRDLAVYEKLDGQLSATADDIAAALFAPEPRVFCLIAEHDREAVGFALWFYSYSTFQGRFGLFLEDLYVRPDKRGLGAGRALLAALARRCVQERLGRMSWAVLDWNAPSIAFYEQLGARVAREWLDCRLEGEALAALAAA